MDAEKSAEKKSAEKMSAEKLEKCRAQLRATLDAIERGKADAELIALVRVELAKKESHKRGTGQLMKVNGKWTRKVTVRTRDKRKDRVFHNSLWSEMDSKMRALMGQEEGILFRQGKAHERLMNEIRSEQFWNTNKSNYIRETKR